MRKSLPLLAIVSLVTGLSNVTALEQGTSTTPPCESAPPPTTPPPPTTAKPAPPTNVRIVGGGGDDLELKSDLEMSSGPNVGIGGEREFAPAPQVTTGPHAYYFALASRSDCAAAYSLRSAAQIEQYRRSKVEPPSVFYLYPNDPDPRQQDAMKIVLPAANNSLSTQVWVPTAHTARTNLLVTFDAWWGREYAFSQAGIPTHKAWQIGSPNADIWTEIQMRFSMAQDDPTTTAWTAIRQYGDNFMGPNVVYGPVFNGRSYGGNVIGPMVGDFGVKPEVWTRFWVFFEVQPDGQWYRMSMWVADANRNPVQIYDGLQVIPRLAGGLRSMEGVWGMVRVEYNTSTSTVASNRAPLVGYARNIVTLKGTSRTGVISLLQRPQQ